MGNKLLFIVSKVDNVYQSFFNFLSSFFSFHLYSAESNSVVTGIKIQVVNSSYQNCSDCSVFFCFITEMRICNILEKLFTYFFSLIQKFFKNRSAFRHFPN
ncbi:DmsC/YnfH family molybdoenzyme membrane anchor subunit [Chryseobacterium sp. NKUCC03_KSP]|uniref:DmsC/YnfH family molybdoenzyme membrane anchor subunit n=1 Tax=Chryseobacterium sp. NKUCC03_KSP TaxID=2842125 RepID=UPI0035A8624B